MDSQNKDAPFPQEIVDDEILPRLDVKSLLKFRCVSKSWRSLIDSKRFIKTHHQNSMKNPSFPHQKVILEHNLLWPELHPLPKFLNEPYFDPFRSEDPTDTPFGGFCVVGCCNGLVCIVSLLATFYMWNPSTRILKELPKVPVSTHALVNCGCGFGWVESSDEYKVYANFVADTREDDFNGYLYSSKTKSWKAVETMDFVAGKCGVFVDGKLHYQRDGEDIIEFFDLKSEVIRKIEMPAAAAARCKLVGVLGDCLCVLLCDDYRNKEVLEVWVMKECWKRVVARDHVLKLLRSAPSSFVGPNGEILVFFVYATFVYYPRDNLFRFFEKCRSYNSRLCIESFESPQDL